MTREQPFGTLNMADNQWPFTLLTTLLSAVTSAGVSTWISKKTLSRQERQWLKDQVTQYVTLSLQYPKLDDDEFVRAWTPADRSEDGLRYANFCCFAFNLIERTWFYAKGDKAEMTSILFFEEIVLRHKRWWRYDKMNGYGYEPKFKQFVDTLIGQEALNDSSRDHH